MKPEAAPNTSSCESVSQRFRVAANGYGKYCPIKNELIVRKGRKTYRIICEEYMIRFTAPGSSEYLIPLAADINVVEFKRCIEWLTDNRNGMDFGAITKSIPTKMETRDCAAPNPNSRSIPRAKRI